ncbi:YciI family protein [Nocardia sp. NPDC052001]|uniref:YciI family protein n=1 Tax=Nocardia sp. NPDC052001 TaxID=3154853 RepID=UPI0034419843
MKFLLNVYVDAVDSQAARAHSTQAADFAESVRRSGELVDGHMFADPSTYTVVRVRNGEPLLTEGPYLETVARASSYYVLDCEDLARAVELAARYPATQFDAVEIRPLMTPAGWEM